MVDDKRPQTPPQNGSRDRRKKAESQHDTIRLIADIQILLRKQHYARAADVLGLLIECLRGEHYCLEAGAAQVSVWVERVKELQTRCLFTVLKGREDEDLIVDFVDFVDSLEMAAPRSKEEF